MVDKDQGVRHVRPAGELLLAHLASVLDMSARRWILALAFLLVVRAPIAWADDESWFDDEAAPREVFDQEFSATDDTLALQPAPDAPENTPPSTSPRTAPAPIRRPGRPSTGRELYTMLGRGLVTRDTMVGYIDTAIPMDQLRVRFDAAYGVNRPSRAEFFWPAKTAPGPGLLGETNINYQEYSLYYEWAPRRTFSLFVDAPFRVIDPTVNQNTGGFGDMNAGFKWAFCTTCDSVTTFQWRTYAPTGDGDRGLGTDHVSLEPALLHYRRLSDRVIFESELRDWIPVGGTPGVQGNILRYGVGLGYIAVQKPRFRLTPIVEVVGWTVLDGAQNVPAPPNMVALESAAGDTIVNVKFGARATIGRCHDFYVGYGRALTGDVWYEDVLRCELRHRF